MNSINRLTARIAATYSTCMSYEDIGTATVLSDKGCLNRIGFKTAAARPHLFRFEFRDELASDDRTYIVCVNQQGAHCTDYDFKGAADKPLSQAVAALYGISKGASGLTSTLIFEELQGFVEKRIVDLEFTELSETRIRGLNCYLLRAAADQILVCGKRDSLIRKAQVCIPTHPGKSILYEVDPRINSSIAPDVFSWTAMNRLMPS